MKCPFCAEMIEDGSIKCRRCDEKIFVQNSNIKTGSGKYAIYLIVGVVIVITAIHVYRSEFMCKDMSMADYQAIKAEYGVYEMPNVVPSKDKDEYLLKRACGFYGYNLRDLENKEKQLMKEGYYYR